MAPNTFWKGYLKLSLVTCPVAMMPATSDSEKVRFHTLNRATGHRVESRYVDAETGKPVADEDQVKGYQTGEDEYIMLEDEELEAVALESTRTIDIEMFVPDDAIGWIWYDRPHYLMPDDAVGEEAFAVIRDAMAATGHGRHLAAGALSARARGHAEAARPRHRACGPCATATRSAIAEAYFGEHRAGEARAEAAGAGDQADRRAHQALGPVDGRATRCRSGCWRSSRRRRRATPAAEAAAPSPTAAWSAARVSRGVEHRMDALCASSIRPPEPRERTGGWRVPRASSAVLGQARSGRSRRPALAAAPRPCESRSRGRRARLCQASRRVGDREVVGPDAADPSSSQASGIDTGAPGRARVE